MPSLLLAKSSVDDRTVGWKPEGPTPGWVFWSASGAIVVLASGVLFGLISQGAIMNDDIGHLVFARESGLTFDYLFTPVFDHFAPGHRLLVYLQLVLGPLSFEAMHAVIAALAGVSALVAIHLLVQLYGARFWIPALGALVILNPFTVDVAGWFASAYHQIPSLLLGLVALDLFVLFRRTGSRWGLAGSVLAVVLGMLFVSKILLFVGVIVLVDHLLLRDESPLESIRSFVEDWPLWMGYLLPILVYLAFAAQTIDERPVGDATDVIAGARIIWLTRFVPSLFGSTVVAEADGSLGGDSLALAILFQSLLSILVILMVWRRRSAAKAVGIVAAAFLVNAVMTLTTRVSLFGPSVGLELYRYWLEPFVVACLLLPWGLASTDLAVSRRVRSFSAIVGLGALVLSVGGNPYQSWVRMSESQNVAAGTWFSNAKSSLESIDGDTIPMIDDRMPEALMPSWIAGGAPVSRLEPLIPRVVFSGDPEGFVFDEVGEIVRARFEPWFVSTGAELMVNGLITITGDVREVGETMCTTGVARLEILLAPPAEPQFIEVTTDSATTIQHLALHEGRIADPAPDVSATAPPGGGAVMLPLNLTPVDAHGVLLAPKEAETCLEEIQIGPIRGTPSLSWEPRP